MPAPNLHVSQHPAVLHKLAILRDETTEPKKFREVVRELSWLLGYEALADARVRAARRSRRRSRRWTAHELGERIGLVPILRAGLGMVDAMLELMPTAAGLAPRACSATSGRSGRSSTTTSCPTRRPSTCA